VEEPVASIFGIEAFCPEDEDRRFLHNIDKCLPNYIPHPRKQNRCENLISHLNIYSTAHNT
jgi:hypothetical protein